jgi:integrase
MANRERDTRSIKGLIDEYIESYAKPKKMSWHDALRTLNKDVLPMWKYLPTADITKKDVDKLLDRVGQPSAKKTLEVLQSMFAFAVEQEILEASPCSDLLASSEATPKDRIFNAEKIRRIWFGLETAKMSEGIKLVIKLVLLTGQRNGEVAGARWEEFDLREKWWTIAGTRTRNKKSHQVFLTPMVVEILEQAKRIGGGSNWVFASGKDKHIAPRSVNLAIRNNSADRRSLSRQNSAFGDFFKVGKFVPNDLRRTAATLMAESGVDRICIAKVLNRATSPDGHAPEIRQALEILEHKLKTILFGGWMAKSDYSR